MIDNKTYMDYYFKNQPRVFEDLQNLSKIVKVDLVKKIYKSDTIASFHSFLSEAKFGKMFSTISSHIFHDQKYAFSKGFKRPDWRIELNGQTIKVTFKEEKYNEFISDCKLPFIICIDAMSRTFLGDFDMQDFFIGHRKNGLFYSDSDFARNVTGILLKGSFGKGPCSYFPNENCRHPLTDENKVVFDQWL